MKKINMIEIARIAGVSLKTVSRVVNESELVKEETKDRVLKVIREYGYQVNLMAKWLRQKKTNIIIVFVGEESLGQWSYWRSQILQKMIQQSRYRGYRIIISASSSVHYQPDNDTDGFNLLKSGMADGAVMFDSAENDVRINYLRENKIPFVIFGKDPHFKDTSYVDLDNYKAGFIGGEYLIERGYKKICVLMGKRFLTVFQSREKGFLQACQHNPGIKYMIYDNDNQPGSTYQQAKAVLKQYHPDAFFLFSGDSKALEVYRAIQEKKLKIPRQVGVLSINNQELCEYMQPALSSIDQSPGQFTRQTIQLLLEQIENKLLQTKRILIEPKLIIRQSTR